MFQCYQSKPYWNILNQAAQSSLRCSDQGLHCLFCACGQVRLPYDICIRSTIRRARALGLSSRTAWLSGRLPFLPTAMLSDISVGASSLISWYRRSCFGIKWFFNNTPVLKITINKDKTLYNQCLSSNTDYIRTKRFQQALPREPVEVLSWCKQVYHSLLLL